jgi:hypothetical protein
VCAVEDANSVAEEQNKKQDLKTNNEYELVQSIIVRDPRLGTKRKE